MSFDRIAPWYRWLETLRFGGLLQEARVAILHQWQAPAPKNVLVLGDGDGRFTAAARERWPEASITLVDASTQMMRLARASMSPSEINTHFVVTPVETFLGEEIGDQRFDLLVSHFFLDCFHEETLERMLARLASLLDARGCWLVTDFQPNGTPWQRFQVWLMYRFFRALTDIEARTLPSISDHLRQTGLTESQSARWVGGWIRSDLWRTTSQ
jgi:ubiquinone/menaquinone biosynthesis C-methylase UbiE